MASAACIKSAGVPVEFMVATILLAMMALFPTPVITTRPLDWRISRTQASKSLSINWVRFSTARASFKSTSMAICLIFFTIFNADSVYRKDKDK